MIIGKIASTRNVGTPIVGFNKTSKVSFGNIFDETQIDWDSRHPAYRAGAKSKEPKIRELKKVIEGLRAEITNLAKKTNRRINKAGKVK